MNPKKHTRGRTCASICGSASIHNRLADPLRQDKRKRPARVFLSLAWRRSNERGGTRPTRQRADARDQMQDPPESFAESRPLATAILVAAIIPQPQLPVKVLPISRHAFECVREKCARSSGFHAGRIRAHPKRNDSAPSEKRPFDDESSAAGSRRTSFSTFSSKN